MENLSFIEITLKFLNFMYFFAYACFGQFCSIAWQQYKFGKRIKRVGGFDFSIFWSENKWRIISTVCAMIAGVLFTEPVTESVFGTAMKLTSWVAFLSGFFTDKTIDAVLNKKA